MSIESGKPAVGLTERPKSSPARTKVMGCNPGPWPGSKPSSEGDEQRIDLHGLRSQCVHDTVKKVSSADSKSDSNLGCEDNICVKSKVVGSSNLHKSNSNSVNKFIVYVVNEHLSNGYGEALIDTGSQISLVKKDSIPKMRTKSVNILFQTVTGELFPVMGEVELCLNNVEDGIASKFYVVKTLPHNVDMILGQDWLENHKSEIRIPWKEECVKLPALSETVVQFPTTERGTRLCAKQMIGENLICAESVVECKDNKYCCLIINCNEDEALIEKVPELSTISFKENTHTRNEVNRNQLLISKLRFSHLSEGQDELRELCCEYNDIFRLPGDRLTETKSTVHNIPTPSVISSRAITQKNYRIPEQHQKEVEKQVDDMLEQGIITPSKSPWNFPILVVPKKIDASGIKKWRICIDFRKLNDITVGDSYPLPNIQDILDKLGRSRYFSALDCASGYWQIPIAQEDQCKTAFSTQKGHFEFKRMAFGLKSAPATFQRLMNTILSELVGPRCLVYLDDVVIFGETLQEHNERLRQVFQRLREHDIQLEPDKCEFLKTELQYLGHIVTLNGVTPDPMKIKAIEEFPKPKTQKDIKSFLGLIGYYRRFLPKFSQLSKPLNDLLKKDRRWKWETEQEDSFNELKRQITNPPVLQFPDFTQPFVLTTDASDFAIGSILSQGKIGEDKPIAFASRSLSTAEINYSTIEKELLAIVWSCKHFRPYLLGRTFTIVTDHKPLTWIFNVKDPSSRLLRWRLLLEEYQFNVVYKAGKKNVNADALSRYPVVGNMQKNNKEIPEERKLKLLQEMHECPIGGHLGIQRTYERLKLYVSWPNMFRDIESYIRKCTICQVNKQTLPKTRAELQITDTQNEPWNKIYLDIVGPFSTSEKSNKYLLTCQDNLSKYMIAIPIENMTAEVVAKNFMNEIILKYGIPDQILTDCGTQFMSDVFISCCKLLKIKKLKTSIYHPETNGSLERSHKSLVEYLRCFSNKMQNDWDQWVPFACFTYNTSPHSITKFTPYELMFGRRANIPGQLQQEPQPLYNYESLVQSIKQKFQVTWKKAKENLHSAKVKQCEMINANRKTKQYEIGDLVLVVKEQRRKLDPLWTGPYEIKEMKDTNVTLVKIGSMGRKRYETHVNRTKPYVADTI